MAVTPGGAKPAQVKLREVLPQERDILSGLLEKYLYELSRYDGSAFGEDGLFGYPYLSSYWDEGARRAYFILADGALAGFALVNRHPACPCPLDWAVAEFFVAYPYRGQGGERGHAPAYGASQRPLAGQIPPGKCRGGGLLAPGGGGAFLRRELDRAGEPGALPGRDPGPGAAFCNRGIGKMRRRVSSARRRAVKEDRAIWRLLFLFWPPSHRPPTRR